MTNGLYKITENFISREEADIILKFFSTYKSDYSNYTAINSIGTLNTWLFTIPTQDELPILHNIFDRMYEYYNLELPKQIEGLSKYRFGSGIAYTAKNGETGTHVDAIDNELNASKYMMRLNIMLQKATSGGEFYMINNGVEEVIDIPELSLISFNSSDIKHGVKKNLGKTPRIIILTDYLYDR